MNYGLFPFPSGHVVQAQMRLLIADITIQSLDVFDVSIPRGFDHLHIDMMLRCNGVGGAFWIHLYLNGDKTTTNYSGEYIGIGGVSVSSARMDLPYGGVATGTTAVGGSFSHSSVFIPFIADDVNYKTYRVMNGEDQTLNSADGEAIRMSQVMWESTAPITRIQVEPSNYPTTAFVTGSRLQVFGVGTFPITLAR